MKSKKSDDLNKDVIKLMLLYENQERRIANLEKLFDKFNDYMNRNPQLHYTWLEDQIDK